MSRLKIFLHQFASPLIYILLLAAVVTLLLREFVDAGDTRLGIYLTKADNYLTMAWIPNPRPKEGPRDDSD